MLLKISSVRLYGVSITQVVRYLRNSREDKITLKACVSRISSISSLFRSRESHSSCRSLSPGEFYSNFWSGIYLLIHTPYSFLDTVHVALVSHAIYTVIVLFHGNLAALLRPTWFVFNFPTGLRSYLMKCLQEFSSEYLTSWTFHWENHNQVCHLVQANLCVSVRCPHSRDRPWWFIVTECLKLSRQNVQFF